MQTANRLQPHGTTASSMHRELLKLLLELGADAARNLFWVGLALRPRRNVGHGASPDRSQRPPI